jgi:hypothetical protein
MTGELPSPGPLAVVGLAGLAVAGAGYALFAACRHAVPEQL